MPVNLIILHCYACGADGRSGGRAGGRRIMWLPNFLGWVVYHIFLLMVLCRARFARESPVITWPRGDTKFLFECWKILHEWAQRMSEIFFQHEKRNFVSPSGHVMFYLLYKHQWTTKPFHFNSFLVWKTRFTHTYEVFARKLTWYFIGVYIIISGIF